MKSKIYILLAISILMFSAANANAQVKGGSFSVTPLAGYNQWPARSSFDNSETYGIAIGYNVSERFSFEATYNVLDTKVVPGGISHFEQDPDSPPWDPTGETVVDTPGGANVDAYQYALELLFYLYPGQRFAPYAAVGVGMIDIEHPYQDGVKSIKDHNGPIGFGFKYFVTDMIAVRGDFRAVMPYSQNNMRATLGVTFQFGGK